MEVILIIILIINMAYIIVQELYIKELEDYIEMMKGDYKDE